MTEPSNAELAARILDLKTDFRAGFDRVETRFAKAVNNDVYVLQVTELTNKIMTLTTALATEVAERKKAVEDEEKARELATEEANRKRTTLYRWVIGVIVVPVGVVILQFYAATRGLG